MKRRKRRMDEYEKLVNELVLDVQKTCNYGEDISWVVKMRIDELNTDDLLKVLRGIAAKIIERDVRHSI
jgi:hypothetical protein